MTIENLWKLIKDLKIINEFVTVPKLNREFAKGWKSFYDVVLPNEKKLGLVKKYLCEIRDGNSKGSEVNWGEIFNNEKVSYENIEWSIYCQ